MIAADEDLQAGSLFPPISLIKEISTHVAVAIAAKAYHAGVATELPKPHDLHGLAQSYRFVTRYRQYR